MCDAPYLLFCVGCKKSTHWLCIIYRIRILVLFCLISIRFSFVYKPRRTTKNIRKKVHKKYFFKMPIDCTFFDQYGKKIPDEDLYGAIAIAKELYIKSRKMTISDSARRKIISRLKKGMGRYLVI